MKTPPPSIEDIARMAHVSKCTVSYALRNHPRASVASRQRIQKIACQMGYRVNPLTSLIMSRVRSATTGQVQATIAYLVNYQSGDQLGRRTYQRLENGLRLQAEQLGFDIERFDLETPGMSPHRLHQILRARNIQGLILSPRSHATSDPILDFNWNQFAIATLGFSFASLPVHRAANFQYHSIRTAYTCLRTRGYRRIALAIDPLSNRKFDHHWRSAFWDLKERDSPAWDPQCCFSLSAETDGTSFMAWIKTYRPDALITESEDCVNFLIKSDLRIPEQIAVAFAKLSDPESGYAGIDQQEEKIGAAAVDLVVEQLSQNRTGFPDTPKTVLIEGVWRAGWTAREAHP